MDFMWEESNFHEIEWLLLIIFPVKRLDTSVAIETKQLFRFLRLRDIAFQFGLKNAYTLHKK